MIDNKKTLIFELTNKKVETDRKTIGLKIISINLIISKKLSDYNVLEKCLEV